MDEPAFNLIRPTRDGLLSILNVNRAMGIREEKKGDVLQDKER